MTRAACLALALALVLVPTLAAAPVPKSLKKPPSPDGVWHMVAVSYDGQATAVEGMERYWVVRGEAVTLGRSHTDPGRPPPPVCKLTTPAPASPHLRRFGDEQLPSVLQVEGDRLHFCYARDPRKELTECQPGQGIVHYVFERVKGEKK
jgi:hypothetical protein